MYNNMNIINMKGLGGHTQHVFNDMRQYRLGVLNSPVPSVCLLVRICDIESGYTRPCG